MLTTPRLSMGNKLMLSSAPADALFISSPLVRFASLNKSNLVFLWWHVTRGDGAMQLINRQREPLDQWNLHRDKTITWQIACDSANHQTIVRVTLFAHLLLSKCKRWRPTVIQHLGMFPIFFFFSKQKFSSSLFYILHFNLKIKFVFPSAQKRSYYLQLEVSYIQYNILQNYDLVW